LVKRCIFSSRRLNSAAIHIQVWPSSCLLALFMASLKSSIFVL
jgi:hypothetical protein